MNIGKKKKFADYSVERELKLSLSDYTNGFEKEEKLETIKAHFEKIKSKPFNWNEGECTKTHQLKSQCSPVFIM